MATSIRTAVIGALSELKAATALHAAGYEVSKPLGIESYDLAARDPQTGRFMRIQVKTGRVREDRNGALKVNARKSNGEPYTYADCDYICAVFGDDVYLIRNRGLLEYWATPENAGKKWRKLSLSMDFDGPEKEEEANG